MSSSILAEPRVEPRTYVVTCFPEEWEESDVWDVRVEYRGPDSWAVTSRIRMCLSSTGNWDHEPSPSSRTDAWKKRHRFPLEKALALAKKAAPTIIVNGLTPEQAWQWHLAHRGPDDGG